MVEHYITKFVFRKKKNDKFRLETVGASGKDRMLIFPLLNGQLAAHSEFPL